MDCTQLYPLFITLLAFLIANIAVIGPLFLWAKNESKTDFRHLDSKIEAMREGTQAILSAIQTEMKDFHGRLERQDAEFKGRLAFQDAEFKGRIALQDAEFKAHLLHQHKE